MRILYSHRIQSRDGQGVHLDSLIAALRAEGHEVQLVGPSAYTDAKFGGGNRWIDGVRRLLPRFVSELLELAYVVPATLKLHRAAMAFRPDAIYERYNLFHLAGVIVARRLRLPLMLEVNAPLADERERFGGLGLKPVARWAERVVWRNATWVLPVTEVLARHVRAAGVDRFRIIVIPNGIDLDEYPDCLAERQTIGGADTLVLGFVGFVRDWHGLDLVVRAIAAHQGRERLILKVVGEGPARAGLERLAAELGVSDRVVFTGLLGRQAIPAEIASFDIALQPASVEYASPLKVFEYMAAGRAIVAPNQANIREVLSDGETGLLFDGDDPKAFWHAVSRLVANAGLRGRLGAAARRALIERDFTWIGNARRVVSLIGGSRR